MASLKWLTVLMALMLTSAFATHVVYLYTSDKCFKLDELEPIEPSKVVEPAHTGTELVIYKPFSLQAVSSLPLKKKAVDEKPVSTSDVQESGDANLTDDVEQKNVVVEVPVKRKCSMKSIVLFLCVGLLGLSAAVLFAMPGLYVVLLYDVLDNSSDDQEVKKEGAEASKSQIQLPNELLKKRRRVLEKKTPVQALRKSKSAPQLATKSVPTKLAIESSESEKQTESHA